MNFGERLIKAREYLGFNQSKFAEKIELAAQSLARYEKNKTKPSMEFITKLTDMFSIDSNWLLTGRGKILLNDEKSSNNPSNCELYKIPLLNQKVSAGHGETTVYKVKPIDELSLCKNLFKTAPGKDILSIQVKGDSMEPTIEDGSFVLFQESHKFDGDDLYIIVKDSELFVKRLYIDMDGALHIKSDNTKYPEHIIDKDSQEYNFIIGKVKQIIPLFKG